MKFSPELRPARLLRRYKRFLADVELPSGEQLTVLCPNTGSMLGLTTPGARVWLSQSSNASRKYALTWEIIEDDLHGEPTRVGINTAIPNPIVAEALKLGKIPELANYTSAKREVKYGENSRIDFLLTGGADGRPCYVEVKNVHLMRTKGLAEFPDSRTARGVKHLRELSVMAATGHRAVMLFVVQRVDALAFSVCGDIDPAYASAFEHAIAANVEMLAYDCRLSAQEIVLGNRLNITRQTCSPSDPRETKRRASAYPRSIGKKPKPR